MAGWALLQEGASNPSNFTQSPDAPVGLYDDDLADRQAYYVSRRSDEVLNMLSEATYEKRVGILETLQLSDEALAQHLLLLENEDMLLMLSEGSIPTPQNLIVEDTILLAELIEGTRSDKVWEQENADILLASSSGDGVRNPADVLLYSIQFSDEAVVTGTIGQEIIDQVHFTDSAGIHKSLLVTDALEILDIQSLGGELTAFNEDRYGYTDVASWMAPGSTTTFLPLVTDILEALCDQDISQVFPLSDSGTLMFSDDLELLHLAKRAVNEALAIAETEATATLTFYLIDKDGLTYEDASLATIMKCLDTKDELIFKTVLFDGEGLDDVKVHAHTFGRNDLRATTTYTEYEFTSYATCQRHNYGIKYNGVYKLEGNSDAGNDIEAKIKTHALDFNTSNIKNVDHVYIGHTTDNNIVLRVLADNEFDVTYELANSESDGLRTDRIDIGRGIQGRYWQFELSSTGTDRLDLDSIEFQPLVNRRRR